MGMYYANALRILAIDAVEKARSGHPGAPMGMADVATVLWKNFVRHAPQDPQLPNRDRVILSNGHASMLLYAALHLMGYRKMSLEALQAFRQFGSCTSGHPEYDLAAGIEMTTGPLGQGIATAVGMALGERLCAERYNREGFSLCDNYTYVFLGDGCLMEGISHEACSLAAQLQLGKLIVLYDSNSISIDGAIEPWFEKDVVGRFRSYGWHCIADVDGHDHDAIYRAIEEARQQERPSFIEFRTIIGYGCVNYAGTSKVHGAPLGKDEIALVRNQLGWNYPPFVIPEDVYAYWNAEEQGMQYIEQWQALFVQYAREYPDLANEYTERLQGTLPKCFDDAIEQLKQTLRMTHKAVSTRSASGTILEALLPSVPYTIGGSADLSSSVCTKTSHAVPILQSTDPNYAGNYISYGVREFAMGAIMNGLSLYCATPTFGGTFLVFADYAKPALRLSALMGIRTIWVLTHDSIGVGEDGPTHQPIEHLTTLRTIPNVYTWRPCDAMETLYAWEFAYRSTHAPTAIVLSRQTLPAIARDVSIEEFIARGAYILSDGVEPCAIIVATGSEVSLALEAQSALRAESIEVRVVSMPCMRIFEEQSQEYRDTVFPKGIPVCSVEAGATAIWEKYASYHVGIDVFGASAPASVLFERFNITVTAIVQKIREMV